MPKHLTEDDVSSTVLRFLQLNRWAIAHYHPPGGQASIALHLASGDRVVPDLVAYRHSILLTIESKGTYDAGDVRKLSSLMNDVAACDQLAHVVWRHARLTHSVVATEWQFRFAHAFDGPLPITHPANVHFIRVATNSFVSSDLVLD
jgi:hypothetical protein